MPLDRQERNRAKGRVNELHEVNSEHEILLPSRPVSHSPYLAGADYLSHPTTVPPVGPHIRTLAHLRELAQVYAHEAIMGHVETMRKEDATDGDRFKAREALLDRGFGKAMQAVKIEDPNDRSNATLAELDEEQAKLKALIEKAEAELKIAGESKK